MHITCRLLVPSLVGIVFSLRPSLATAEPHRALLSSHAPIHPGVEVTLAADFEPSQSWGFFDVEGDLPIVRTRRDNLLGLKLRLPSTLLVIPSENRRALSPRALDIEIWGLGTGNRIGSSYHGGGVGFGLNLSGNSVFYDGADLGTSLWGFYRGYLDLDVFEWDIQARLGGNDRVLLIADLSLTTFIETGTQWTPSIGLFSPVIAAEDWQRPWLNIGVIHRPTTSVEISGGCALFLRGQSEVDDIAFPCRPYLSVGTWKAP